MKGIENKTHKEHLRGLGSFSGEKEAEWRHYHFLLLPERQLQ